MKRCLKCRRLLMNPKYTDSGAGPYGSKCVRQAGIDESNNLFSEIKPEPTRKEKIQDLAKNMASDYLFSRFDTDEQLSMEAEIIISTDEFAEAFTEELLKLLEQS